MHEYFRISNNCLANLLLLLFKKVMGRVRNRTKNRTSHLPASATATTTANAATSSPSSSSQGTADQATVNDASSTTNRLGNAVNASQAAAVPPPQVTPHAVPPQAIPLSEELREEKYKRIVQDMQEKLASFCINFNTRNKDRGKRELKAPLNILLIDLFPPPPSPPGVVCSETIFFLRDIVRKSQQKSAKADIELQCGFTFEGKPCHLRIALTLDVWTPLLDKLSLNTSLDDEEELALDYINSQIFDYGSVKHILQMYSLAGFKAKTNRGSTSLKEMCKRTLDHETFESLDNTYNLENLGRNISTGDNVPFQKNTKTAFAATVGTLMDYILTHSKAGPTKAPKQVLRAILEGPTATGISLHHRRISSYL